ncbi:MAG: type II secretion system F family protein [Phycisphaerales bacterium]
MSRAGLPSSTTPFFFVANKIGGGKNMGVRNARTQAQLAEVLRKEKMLLQRAYALPKWAGSGDVLPMKDSVVLNEQLAQLLARGVPLVEALEVAASTVSVHARPTIDKMRDMVAAGSSFSDACAKVGGFDVVTIAIYRAAERTGDLAGSAKELAVNARRTMGVAGKAQTLAIYPAIVMTVSVLVAFSMITFIVPKLASQIAEVGTPPWYTRVLAAMGEFSYEHLTYIVLLALIFVVILFAMRKPFFGAAWRLLRKTPLLRDVVLAQESARFFSVMSAMTRAGVPLADALATANQAIHHPRLRSQMDKLRVKLVEGGVLRVLIEQVDSLPLATRKLLIAAERAGDLEAAFGTLANDMIDQVERTSQRVLAVLQPATIVIMFVVVGGLLLAILVPLLTIAGQVGAK